MKDTINKFLDLQSIEHVLIDPKTIIFRYEFLEKCQMNYCGRYNKSWSCPPAIGDVLKIQDYVLSFSKAYLYQMVFPLEDSYDYESMEKGRNEIMAETLALNSLLLETEDIFCILSAGSCQVCKDCTYPDKPCRFPEKMLFSMESLGIDVAVLAREYGMKYYHGPLTITYFSICFF